MASNSSISSDMEHYLGSQLFEAQEREERLTLQLQAAQEEFQELESCAAEYKFKYQHLDDALEAEQCKTNAESLAREKAEETVAQLRAQVLKQRRDEVNANKHCEVAEAEIVSLQEELSKERSKIAAWCELCSRLDEDLRRAETSELTAYDLLEAAKAKACSLQEELIDIAEHKKEAEYKARGLEKSVQEEHQRATEAEIALHVLKSEVKSKDVHISDLLEKYDALEAKYSECGTGRTSSNTNSLVTSTQHPPCTKSSAPSSTKHSHSRPNHLTKHPLENPTIKPPPKKPTLDLAIMPTPPQPAILRPALASIQVEMFKPPTAGKALPFPTISTNTNKLRWAFFWRLPAETLELLFGGRGSTR